MTNLRWLNSRVLWLVAGLSIGSGCHATPRLARPPKPVGPPCIRLTQAELESAEPFGSERKSELDVSYAKVRLFGFLSHSEGRWHLSSSLDIQDYDRLTKAQADAVEPSTWQDPPEDPDWPDTDRKLKMLGDKPDMLQLEVDYIDGTRRSRLLPFRVGEIADGEGDPFTIDYSTVVVFRPEVSRLIVRLYGQEIDEIARPDTPMTVEALVLAAHPRRIAIRVEGSLKPHVHVHLYREADDTRERTWVDARELFDPTNQGVSPCWLLLPRTESELEGSFVLRIYNQFHEWTARHEFPREL